MVKRDDKLRSYQFAIGVSLLRIGFLFVGLSIVEVVIPPKKRVPLFLAGVLLISPFLAACLLGVARFWRRRLLDQKRMKVQMRDQSHHTEIDIPIGLPLLISLSARYIVILLLCIGYMLVFGAMWFASTLIILNAYANPPIIIGLIYNNTCAISVIIIFMPLTILFMTWILTKEFDQQIMVSEEGLMVTRAGSSEFISFDAAKLFAKFAWPYILIHRHDYCEYELSNQTSIVRFVRILKKETLWLKTGVPFEEYNRQMESLIKYVEIRTALQVSELT